jgi:hypothetical protein
VIHPHVVTCEWSSVWLLGMFCFICGMLISLHIRETILCIMICLNAAWAERFYFTCGICLGSMTLKQFVWILVWFVDMVKSSRLCLEDIYMWNPTTKHNSCVLRIPILCLNLSLKPFEHICFFWCQEPLENISHQMQWTHIVAQTSTFFFGKHMYFVYQWQSGYCRDTGTYIYTYLFI